MNILLFSKQIHKNARIKKLESLSSRAGFLLIELMVSISLFIYFMYIVSTYLAMTQELSHDALKRTHVLSLLETFIDDVKNNTTLLQQKKFKKDDCTITWTQKPFMIQQPAFLKSTCFNITFQASWPGKNNKINNIALTTGIIL